MFIKKKQSLGSVHHKSSSQLELLRIIGLMQQIFKPTSFNKLYGIESSQIEQWLKNAIQSEIKIDLSNLWTHYRREANKVRNDHHKQQSLINSIQKELQALKESLDNGKRISLTEKKQSTASNEYYSQKKNMSNSPSQQSRESVERMKSQLQQLKMSTQEEAESQNQQLLQENILLNESLKNLEKHSDMISSKHKILNEVEETYQLQQQESPVKLNNACHESKLLQQLKKDLLQLENMNEELRLLNMSQKKEIAKLKQQIVNETTEKLNESAQFSGPLDTNNAELIKQLSEFSEREMGYKHQIDVLLQKLECYEEAISRQEEAIQKLTQMSNLKEVAPENPFNNFSFEIEQSEESHLNNHDVHYLQLEDSSVSCVINLLFELKEFYEIISKYQNSNNLTRTLMSYFNQILVGQSIDIQMDAKYLLQELHYDANVHLAINFFQAIIFTLLEHTFQENEHFHQMFFILESEQLIQTLINDQYPDLQSYFIEQLANKYEQLPYYLFFNFQLLNTDNLQKFILSSKISSQDQNYELTALLLGETNELLIKNNSKWGSVVKGCLQNTELEDWNILNWHQKVVLAVFTQY